MRFPRKPRNLQLDAFTDPRNKCGDCGAHLTDPISISIGIGPGCRKKRLDKIKRRAVYRSLHHGKQLAVMDFWGDAYDPGAIEVRGEFKDIRTQLGYRMGSDHSIKKIIHQANQPEPWYTWQFWIAGSVIVVSTMTILALGVTP